MKYSDIPNYITDIIDNALEFIKKIVIHQIGQVQGWDGRSNGFGKRDREIQLEFMHPVKDFCCFGLTMLNLII